MWDLEVRIAENFHNVLQDFAQFQPHLVLLCLMESKCKVASRERLMERLWETDSFVDENNLTSLP